ncbi:CYTH domain-containing protein [Micromonospora haikouensis]|uniref:CYTH domain-containing protein n=1 Tax=Micromonospora haikouensis TaxID=686309 RepID=UPI003D735BA9
MADGQLEIERKFLVDDGWVMPGGLVGVPMRQAYLTAEHAVPEVRIRWTAAGSTMTIKAPAGLTSVATVRTEIEFPLADDVFEQLWALPSVDRLDKVRTVVQVGPVEAAVDTYAGDLAPLRVVEVEFASLAEATAFEPPAWFGPEVTGQKRYGNRALAIQASARSAGPGLSAPGSTR